jgi:trehalose/maltose transport system substrate-binding protein
MAGNPTKSQAAVSTVFKGTQSHVPPRRGVSLRALIALLFFLMLTGCGREVEPVTLRYAHSWLTRPDDLARMAALSQKFTQETGIHIKHIPTPESSHDYLELTRKLLAMRSSGADLLATDVIWSSVLEPDLVDLRPYLTSELALLEPRLLAGYEVNGKLVAVPYAVPIGGIEYRADLLRKYGYDHPPKSWDELERMARRIQTGERAKGKKDFWGYVWQGTAAEALTCNALEWQAAEGAGLVVEQNKTISVNNAAAIRTWRRARHWIGWISPPAVLAYRERDSMNVFDSGRAAFDRIWLVTPISKAGQARQIGWRSSAPLVETGFSRMPGGPGGSGGALGGNGLAISRYSAHIPEAIKLVQFLIRAQIQAAELGSPSRTAPYSHSLLPEVTVYHDLAAQPDDGVVMRPSIVSGIAYEQVTRAYFTTVHAVLAGQQEAPEAAAALEKQLIRITGFRPGPPAPRKHALE